MTTIISAVLRHDNHQAPYAESRPLELTTLELAPPLPGELLIRIDAAGVCHSDLSVINGDRPRPLPMALGHEATGLIEAMGDPADTKFAIGDRVVLVFLPACGECARCAGGEGYLCEAGAAANAFIAQRFDAAGLGVNLIALLRQFGYLILPPVVPIVLWILLNRPFLEGLVGWDFPTSEPAEATANNHTVDPS